MQRLEGLPPLRGAGARGAREGGEGRVDAAARTPLARLRLLSVAAVRNRALALTLALAVAVAVAAALAVAPTRTRARTLLAKLAKSCSPTK